MPELVRITDVAPRDGLQNEPGVIPTPDKAELVRLLCATGVDEVEVTSFVSAKWVPQLTDAGELLDRLRSGSPSQREGAGGRAEGCTQTPSITGIGGRHDGSLTPAKNEIALNRAQGLRKAATGPEQELWKFLQGKQLGGFRFRRQHPFGPFILDFYCVSEKLVVEIDGRTHRTVHARQHDVDRTTYLESYGLRVVRFSDDDVIEHGGQVAATILDVLQGKRVAPRSSPSPPPPPSGRGSPILSALVPNERGLQGVLDANARAGWAQIGKVAVFTAASETFCKRNINATIEESIARFVPVILGARRAGLRTRGYISCVVACPFEGPIAPRSVADVARRLIDAGIDELDLGDTIGAGTPETIGAVLKAAGHIHTLTDPETFTLHLHDTFGRAAECVKAALAMGVRSFDGSVAGLGGCPYASTPTRRAPGNISTRTLVETIHGAGYRTNVNMDRLEDAGRFAMRIVAAARLGTADRPSQ